MTDLIPKARNLNWLIGIGCFFLMAVVLYMEHAMHLEPCPLCIFQRLAVIGVGTLAIIAAIHNPTVTGIKIYGLLTAVTALIGGALSSRQLYLQSLPADQVPSCGPGLNYLLDVFPMMDVIRMVLEGDGSCAEVVWTFVGVSIPGWALLGFAGLIFLSALQIFRPRS